jgi:hypothetical protein
MACSAENGYENSVNPTRQSSNRIWLQVATVYYHNLHHAFLLPFPLLEALFCNVWSKEFSKLRVTESGQGNSSLSGF